MDEPKPVPRRQMDVLLGLAAGGTYGTIARTLRVSEATVKSAVHGLYGRLGARSAAHAVDLAYRRGILRVDVEGVDGG